MDSQLIQPNISVFFYVFPKKQGILSSNRWNTISNLKSWSDSVLEILIIAWRKLLTSVHSTNTRVKLLPEKLHHWGRKQKGPQVTQSQTRVWNPLRDSREARHSQAPKRPHYTGSQLPPPMLIFLPPKSPPSAQGLQVRDTENHRTSEKLWEAYSPAMGQEWTDPGWDSSPALQNHLESLMKMQSPESHQACELGAPRGRLGSLYLQQASWGGCLILRNKVWEQLL